MAPTPGCRFAPTDNVDHPISLYAATKKANELMAHAYAHLFQVPATGLRFFTVYGPWGRPDMAMWLFTEAILRASRSSCSTTARCAATSPISTTWWRRWCAWSIARRAATRHGRARRPIRAAAPRPGGSTTSATTSRSRCSHLVELIEQALGRSARRELLPMQPGDVPETYADVDDLMRDVGFRPATAIADGVARFVAWYRQYHKL